MRHRMHRLPGRNAQSQIEQIDGGTHFGRILCQPPNVALNQHEILR